MTAATLHNYETHDEDIYCPTWLKREIVLTTPPKTSHTAQTKRHEPINFSNQTSTPNIDSQSKLYQVTIEFLESENKYYIQFQQYYQAMQKILSHVFKGDDIESQRHRSLYLDDLQVILKYNYKFCQRSKGSSRSHTILNIGTVLNDTMLIHSDYKQSLISLMVKSAFKKTLIMKMMASLSKKIEHHPQLCHGVVEFAVERLFHYRRWLKQLIDLKTEHGGGISKIGLDKNGRGNFETFELQLALLKVNKILEVADTYGEVTNWDQVVQFDQDTNKSIIGQQDVFGDRLSQDDDLRLQNSEAGNAELIPNPKKITEEKKFGSSSTNEVSMMNDLIVLKRIMKNLSDVENSLQNYVDDLNKFLTSQMHYCQIWYQFFVSPEEEDSNYHEQTQTFDLNSVSTITYIYKSFIERWQQRVDLTRVYIGKLKVEIGERAHSLLQLIRQVTGKLMAEGAKRVKYDARQHTLIKEMLTILQSETTCHIFVYKWNEMQLEWMAQMIGTKGLHEYRDLLRSKASNENKKSADELNSNTNYNNFSKVMTGIKSDQKSQQKLSAEIRNDMSGNTTLTNLQNSTSLDNANTSDTVGKYSDIVKAYHHTISLTMELLQSSR